jgi:hypothetical protein
VYTCFFGDGMTKDSVTKNSIDLFLNASGPNQIIALAHARALKRQENTTDSKNKSIGN